MLLALANSTLGINADLLVHHAQRLIGKRMDVESPSSDAKPSMMRRESQAEDDPTPDLKKGGTKLMRREAKRKRAAAPEPNTRSAHSNQDHKDSASEHLADLHPSSLVEVASSTASSLSAASQQVPANDDYQHVIGQIAGNDDSLRRRRRALPCTVTEWGEWGHCSAECGGGIQQKERSTSGPVSGGPKCTGNSAAYQECGTEPCQSDCEWNSWGAWGPCSKSCGGGNRIRWRGPLPYTELDGGKKCTGEDKKTATCNSFACPIDCTFGAWGLFGGCTTSCGSGQKIRERPQYGPLHDGKPCAEEPTEAFTCNAFTCPADCIWNAWGAWGECSRSCGGGQRIKERKMLQQALNGGLECQGAPAEVHPCNVEVCPIDCVWSEWHAPGPCSKTCGGGAEHRHRTILAERTEHGAECEGGDTDVNACNVAPCAVDCFYDEWLPWTECTVSCGGGTRRTSRNYTAEQYGGVSCEESNGTKEEECNVHSCPVETKGGTRRHGAFLTMIISVTIMILQGEP